MAQYEATFRMVDTSNGVTIKKERFGFNAKDVSESIVQVGKRQARRNGYFHRNGNRYVLRLSNLRLIDPGRLGIPQYDPAADICDDCYRPFWKGHNLRIEH